MADTTFRTVLPPLKAVDNGDGTYSVAISIENMAALLDDIPVNGETDKGITSNWAFDHNALDTGVHGAGGDVLATDADIATHAALTDIHSITRAATLVVAANDSSVLSKAQADYVGDGTADDVEIQAALTAAGAASDGRVILLEGTYNLVADISVPANVKLEGQGWSTILLFDDSGGGTVTNAGAVTVSGNNVRIANLKIELAAGCGAGGTRPNGITANTRTDLLLENLWIYGDSTVADDGSQLRQNGIYLQNVTNSKIMSNTTENNRRNNIHSNTCTGLQIIGNNTTGAGMYEISTSATEDSIIADNIFSSRASYFAGQYNVISGNIFRDSNSYGFWADAISDSTITGNICINNTIDGMRVRTSDRLTITGNTFEGNGAHGLYIFRSDYVTVTGNSANNNTSDGINIEGDGAGNADYNQITGNVATLNGDKGIEIVGGANANYNRVMNNQLNGNVTAAFADAGTNTQLATYVVPFSDGSDPQDSGYEIDAGGEFARAWLRLPAEVQQVMGMKVYARTVVLEADEMELEMVVLGGADNEPYNTHDGSIAQLDSVSANFAADDVIFWRNTEAGVLALVGGDSVEVKVLHEAAQGANCATDAFFRTVEIEYV